jgi:hypothetical protein
MRGRFASTLAQNQTDLADLAAYLASVAGVQTGPNLDQQGLTGSWYEAAEDGQGFEIEVYPDLMAAGTGLLQGAWFTFDVAPAGGADHERWYTFNGPAQSGAANVACVEAAAATTKVANADFALSGNWYDAATSGQGFVFEVNPLAPVVFFAWYTYASAGQAAGAAGQRWFTGQGTFMPGTHTAPLTLYETTGGVFDTPTPMAQTTVAVGTATVTFASCTSAQLQFNFTSGANAGHAGMIALSRVGSVPAGCAVSADAKRR